MKKNLKKKLKEQAKTQQALNNPVSNNSHAHLLKNSNQQFHVSEQHQIEQTTTHFRKRNIILPQSETIQENKSISTTDLSQYEKFFFENICNIDTGNRKNFSTALSEIPNANVAFAQDTISRLTRKGGRLSKFQWRICVFYPIEEKTNLNILKDEIFKSLKNEYPHFFVRSYVYVIFIKKTYNLFSSNTEINKDNFQIYYSNTKYEIKSGQKNNLFNISKENNKEENKIFIVSNPQEELKRIQSENSDIIDAVRAFSAELPLVEQTENTLREINEELDKNPNAHILIEGAARSGKTVIAMSLLKRRNARMLLMNRYFYEALKDAIKALRDLSDEELENLFTTKENIVENIVLNRLILDEINKGELKENDIQELTDEYPAFFRYIGDHWRIQTDKYRKYVIVHKKDNTLSLKKLIPQTSGNSNYFKFDDKDFNCPDFKNKELILKELQNIKDELNRKDYALFLSDFIKKVSDMLQKNQQIFAHHNAKPEYKKGFWEYGKIFSNDCLFICDEAQRLGIHKENEIEWVNNHQGGIVLIGDDNQRLNPRTDLGLDNISHIKEFTEIQLTHSIGIPQEITDIVKSMLGIGNISPFDASDINFDIQLIFNDDKELVTRFHNDILHKKHFAIPINTGFYNEMNEDCRTITCPNGEKLLMISPESDPKNNKREKDLTKELKFFCHEQVMPQYVLSAYELVSREIDSIYIKIPKEMTIQDILYSKEWLSKFKRNHLYVLMTRATTKLTISVGDWSLYQHFLKVLKKFNIY